MIRNYLLIAYRNLVRNKIFSSLNIVGLSIGVTAALIIGSFVIGELQVDAFQKEAANTYLLHWKQQTQGGGSRLVGLTGEKDASLLRGQLASVSDVLNVRPFNTTFEYNEAQIKSDVMIAERHFFDFFSFQLLEGDPASALADPSSLVITESLAKTIFGNQNPIGKSVRIVGDFEMPLQVTGVVKDYPDSHLKVSAILSWNAKTTTGGELSKWYRQSLYTYLKTPQPVAQASLAAEITEVYKAANYELDKDVPQVIAVKDIYMGGADLEFMAGYRFGSRFIMYTLGAVGVLTLLMACINFINASTAQSMKRAKEVGVRKSMGASTTQLRWQFLMEAFIIVTVATLLGITLADLGKPYFTALTGKSIYINLWNEPSGLLLIIAVFVLTIVLSGFYPAVTLSSWSPVESLRGKMIKGKDKRASREALMTFQFAITLCLIAGTVLIYRQNQYMQTKDLGFDKEQVIVMSVRQNSAIFKQQEAFMQELAALPNVETVSAGMDALGNGYTNNSYYVVPEGGTVTHNGIMSTYFTVDDKFAEVYGIAVAQGRFLNNELASDTAAVVINQSLAKNLGYEDPVNRLVKIWGDDYPAFRIVGVLEDFHFQSLHKELQPAICILNQGNGWNLAVRLSGNDYPQTLSQIQAKWERMESDAPFNYSFLDDSFARFYQNELRLFKAINFFSLLSIIVAGFGLYGLTSFMVQQRTKEIGIRKVLGASVSGILLLLNRRLVLLLGIALALATPVTVVAVNAWLKAFAYSNGIGWSAFLLAGIAVAAIVISTVCLISLNTVRRNPVKALRYE